MRGKIKAAAILLMALLLGIQIRCSTPAPKQTAPMRPIRIAYRSIVSSLDPLSENTIISGSIYSNIYESLVGRTANFQFRPILATGWSTPDDRTWIFELRQDVKFHDGTPFTADDVVFSFDRTKAAATAQQSTALTIVERVEAVDSHTIRIVTREPSSNLLARIYSLSIQPRKYFSSPSKGFMPGTGPYRVRAWEPGQWIDLIANENYWGSKPLIQQIRFAAVPDIDQSARLLLKGDIDLLPELEPSVIDRFGLKNHKNILVQNYPGLLVIYFSFDTMHGALPPLSSNPFLDLRVRKAFYHAIHVDQIIREIQKGYATEATQLVAPMVYGYNRDIQRLSYDPAEARKLLAQAGYPDGFEVRLDLPNNRYRADVDVGKALAADLAAVGIRVQLNPQPRDEWMKIRQSGQSQLFLAGWMVGSGDAGGALDYLIHSPDHAGYGRANSGGYHNPQIDSIIEQSGSAMDPKKRLDLLEKSMALAMADVAGVPLYIEQNLAASNASIKWEPRPDEIIQASSISRLDTNE